MRRRRYGADPARVRSDTLFWLFGWYLRWFFWRRFRAVRLSRTGLPDAPAGRPLIIYSNHPSWWDPAFYILLQAKLFPGRRGFGPMDATALGKYGLLARMGVFGIELDSPRGAARFLRTSLALLGDTRNVLWITAEGAFTDPRARPVRLRPGVAHLALTAGVPVVPVGLEGTEKIQPVGSNLPKLATIKVTFGKPIEVAGRYDGVPLGRARREVTDEIMHAIHQLTGQVLAGVYNDRAPDA